MPAPMTPSTSVWCVHHGGCGQPAGFSDAVHRRCRHGLDDLLAELGYADLSDEIPTRTDRAIELAIRWQCRAPGVATDTESIEALHDAVKDVADLLKTDLVTVLSLEVPAEAAGDND